MAEELTREIYTKKKFAYAKNGVVLAFELSVDNSKELRDFHALLKAANEDIENILNEMKN